MRIKQIFALYLSLSLVMSGLQAQELSNRLDSMSYALGYDLGRSLNQLDLSLNSDVVFQAMTDVLEEKETLLTDQDVKKWLTAFQEEAQAAQQKSQAAKFEGNRKAGEEFLQENQGKEGVTVTASGLQYKVINEGSGPQPPSPQTTVKVHYEGKLLDGTVFDSSYERGEPTEFPLNRVIPGWTEGLQLMKEGAKYRFFIPYNLAYGERGAGQSIPPYSALIFDVELLEVKE